MNALYFRTLSKTSIGYDESTFIFQWHFASQQKLVATPPTLFPSKANHLINSLTRKFSPRCFCRWKVSSNAFFTRRKKQWNYFLILASGFFIRERQDLTSQGRQDFLIARKMRFFGVQWLMLVSSWYVWIFVFHCIFIWMTIEFKKTFVFCLHFVVVDYFNLFEKCWKIEIKKNLYGLFFEFVIASLKNLISHEKWEKNFSFLFFEWLWKFYTFFIGDKPQHLHIRKITVREAINFCFYSEKNIVLISAFYLISDLSALNTFHVFRAFLWLLIQRDMSLHYQTTFCIYNKKESFMEKLNVIWMWMIGKKLS